MTYFNYVILLMFSSVYFKVVLYTTILDLTDAEADPEVWQKMWKRSNRSRFKEKTI